MTIWAEVSLELSLSVSANWLVDNHKSALNPQDPAIDAATSSAAGLADLIRSPMSLRHIAAFCRKSSKLFTIFAGPLASICCCQERLN